jgi:AcrR family transcriptional regulator
VKGTGVWGGRTTEQRRAERRNRMIDAAVEIWSEQGWAAVSMRRVCARTSLNDRYFYDEFTNRDGLLVAVLQTIQDELLGPVAAGYARCGPDVSWEQLTRIVTTALIDRVVAEPTRARILLSRTDGSTVLDEHRRKAFQRSIDLVTAAARPRLRPGFDEQALRMDAIIGVGGCVELLTAWQGKFLAVDSRRLIEHICDVANRFGGPHLQSADGIDPMLGEQA